MRERVLVNDRRLVIGLVGVCGSGKSTLAAGLAQHGIAVRQIAQEHSYVPHMWQRIAKPDILICLEASYPVTLQRKPFHWTEQEYQQQVARLRHARQHADLRIDTDALNAGQVLERALEFLKGRLLS